MTTDFSFELMSQSRTPSTAQLDARRRLTETATVIIGPRASDFVALWRIGCPSAAIVAEGGPEARSFVRPKHGMIALEDQLRLRRLWSSSSMDELIPYVREVLSNPRLTKSQLAVVPYAVSDALEADIRRYRPAARIIGPRAALRHRFDDKLATRTELRRIGIPVLHGEPVDLSSIRLSDLKRRFGLPVVVQSIIGSSGLGTYFIRSESDLTKIRNAAGDYLATPYGGDCVLNAHALLSDDGAVISPLSVQLAGLPDHGIPAPIYCGNDFSAVAAVEDAVTRAADSAAQQVADRLIECGYRGIAGIDFIVSGNSVTVLEINPRLQGSTWLLSESEYASGAVPMLINALLGVLEDNADQTSAAQPALGGAQLILRLPARLENRRPLTAVLPGIYVWEGQRLVYNRPAIGLAECRRGEIYVGGLVDAATPIMDSFAVRARVAAWEQLIAVDGRTLTAYGDQILRTLSC